MSNETTHDIDVVLFAGHGGSELGRRRARGNVPSIAINHSPEAIAVHSANFPDTAHFIEDVYQVDPRVAAAGRRVRMLWLSPDCTHHSRAKGGKPRAQKIRGLAWAAIPWAKHCRPDVIMLENVREWLDWGPIERSTGQPIKARRGQTFRAWRCKLEALGYVVESRVLKACDYGTPTTRERVFVVARCDGKPIRWPSPTHAPAGSAFGRPYRTAAECIDWSIPCPSIFSRRRPLAEKTLARVVRGIGKYVLGAQRPFVIPVNHGGVGRRDHRVHDVEDPMPTVTGGQRGGHAVVAPYLVHRGNVERPGQAPRTYDVQRPLSTVVAQGEKHGLTAAFLAKHYSERETGGWNGGASADRPIDTVTARDHHSLVAASMVRYNGDRPGAERVADLADPLGTQDTSRRFGLVAANLVKLRGTSSSHIDASSLPVEAPVPTISAGGTHVGVAASFLARYNRTGEIRPVDSPLGTQDTTDRYALVSSELEDRCAWSPAAPHRAHDVYELMVAHGYKGPGLDHDHRIVLVNIDGGQYVIADVGMRMLVPRELFRAMGFPDDFVIDPIGPNGKPLSKTAQIRGCGNAVPPQPVEQLIRINLSEAA